MNSTTTFDAVAVENDDETHKSPALVVGCWSLVVGLTRITAVYSRLPSVYLALEPLI